MKKHIVGLALGTLTGGLHLIWSILVAVGWAQPLHDWILKLHFVSGPYQQIAPFDIGTAALLVVVTFCVGYIVGKVFTMLYGHYSK